MTTLYHQEEERRTRFSFWGDIFQVNIIISKIVSVFYHIFNSFDGYLHDSKGRVRVI